MEPIGPDVARELHRFGGDAEVTSVAAVWPRAVGDGIARHAWPARLDRTGTLHVATESATWAFELTHFAPELLERLRALLSDGAPAALRFAVGPLPASGVPDEPRRSRKPADPTAGEEAEAARLVAGIADAGLRELVAATAAASLARARLGPQSDR
jgi:hypothetical protein